jgi:hypothetical protein
VTDLVELDPQATDQPLVARFAVANAGTQPLVFRRSGPACCGAGVLPPAVTIAPGRTGEIVLELGAEDLTHGQQRFGYLSNDPARPEFWLTVRRPPPPAPPRREEHSVLVKRK